MPTLYLQSFRAIVTTSCIVAFMAVNAAAITVDFDDLSLPVDPYWNGPAANAFDEPDPFGGPLPLKVGTFASHGVAFGNEYNLNYSSWGGFAYSRVTDNVTPGFGNQFSAFPFSGHGAGDDIYGVAFGYSSNTNPQSAADVADLPYLELPAGAVLQSAYLTNDTYAALSMRDGDTFAKKFGGDSGTDPDWFKLSIYGTDAGGSLLPQLVEFYLADFRGDNDYIVDTWELLDLSSLAAARKLYFNLSSSDVGEFGMNTPATFAIDDVQFAIVPEPASWLLLALGITGLVVRRHRSR